MSLSDAFTSLLKETHFNHSPCHEFRLVWSQVIHLLKQWLTFDIFSVKACNSTSITPACELLARHNNSWHFQIRIHNFIVTFPFDKSNSFEIISPTFHFSHILIWKLTAFFQVYRDTAFLRAAKLLVSSRVMNESLLPSSQWQTQFEETQRNSSSSVLPFPQHPSPTLPFTYPTFRVAWEHRGFWTLRRE